MKQRDADAALVGKDEDSAGMNRRDFLQMTAAVSAGLLAGSAGTSCSPEIGSASGWAPVSFPKLIFYNCRLFDGVHRQIQKDRVVVVEGGKIRGVEPRGDLGGFRSYKSVDLDGRIEVKVRVDKRILRALNGPGAFRGHLINADNIGKSSTDLAALWNEDHPDDPVA